MIWYRESQVQKFSCKWVIHCLPQCNSVGLWPSPNIPYSRNFCKIQIFTIFATHYQNAKMKIWKVQRFKGSLKIFEWTFELDKIFTWTAEISCGRETRFRENSDQVLFVSKVCKNAVILAIQFTKVDVVYMTYSLVALFWLLLILLLILK